MGVYWYLLGVLISLGLHAGALPQDTPRIAYDDVQRGQLNDSTGEETWLFTGQQGDLILIDTRALDMNNLDPYLTLNDANGTTLFTDDDSGDRLNARIGPITLPASGDYTIIVSRYSGGGDYSLEVVNLKTAPVLTLGKPLAGETTIAQPSSYFLLDTPVENRQPIWRLRVSDDQPFTDPYLSIYGANGLIHTTEYDEEGVIDPLIVSPAEPVAVVVSWNSSSSGGPYELTLTESEVELLETGVPQTGSLDMTTFAGRHYFVGKADQPIRVTVTRTDGEITPVLKLFANDTQTSLFYSEGSYAEELSIRLTLPAEGLYVIEVTDGAYSEQGGTYTVQIDTTQ